MKKKNAHHFRITSIGTYVLTHTSTGHKQLGSVIKNSEEGGWMATHKGHKVSTCHAKLELAKAWLLALETKGVDIQKDQDTDLNPDAPDVPYIDPVTGAMMVPLPGGGVQVIPVPQPLVVWRTALDNLEAAHTLSNKALSKGLGAQSSVQTIHASFATEDGVLERTEHQVDIMTCADQVSGLEALLLAQTSDSTHPYMVLPVLTAPTSYAAWLRRHSAGFAPDDVPQE